MFLSKIRRARSFSFLADKLIEITNHKSRLGLLLAATTGFYLSLVFVKELSCSSGLLGCGLEGFGVVFPLYIFLAALMRNLTMPVFTVLYAVSSVLYIYIAHLSGSALERLLWEKGEPLAGGGILKAGKRE